MIDGEGEGRPHQEVSSDEVLSPEQAGQLVAAAEPGLYQTLFLTALVSGARIGELTALAWADVDLDGRTLAIRRNLSWASTRAEGKGLRPRFFEPKTRASRRTLRLPTELVSALKRWKLACPLGRFGLVFPDAAGDPLHRKRVYARGLLPALKKAKLPHVTIHSLRHSFASALIMQGAPVTEVASLLGHSSPTVTLNVYSHWFQRVRTTSVETLARTVVAGISNEVGSKTVAA
jgi:integrase